MYTEVQPSRQHRQLIDSLWIYTNENVTANFKVFPDPYVDLIFDLTQRQGFISGMMSTHQARSIPANGHLIGARINTEMVGAITKVPLRGTKNLRLDFSALLPPIQDSLFEQLSTVDPIQGVSIIERFIADQYAQNHTNQDKAVLSVVRVIRAQKGRISISSLARSAYLSVRQLERRFLRATGLTVKEFANVVRFDFARGLIAQSPQVSLLEIAFNTGFFDHSHMARTFKQLADEKPSFFR